MSGTKKYKYDWFKIMLCAIALGALMVLAFNAYSTDILDTVASLSEDEKSPNLIWVIENLSMVMPGIVFASVLTLFYADKQKYIPVVTQREKLIVALIVAAVVFIGILGYVLVNSGEQVDPESGEVIKSLWDKTAVLFLSQILPFIIIISYHAIRAESEEKELPSESSEEEKCIEL